MDTSMFMATLRQLWYLALALILISVGAGVIYDRYSYKDQAQATVTALDVVTTRAAGYSGAQVTVDSILKSDQLADRVAQRAGEPPGSLSKQISVNVVPSLAGATISPLYSVRIKAKGTEHALYLLNVALEEGRTLYLEQNSVDLQAVQASLAQENKLADDQLTAARAALNQFATEKNAISLPDRLHRQMDVVAAMRQQLSSLQAAEAASFSSKRGSIALAASLAGEQTELDRLNALKPDYDRLAFQVSAAEARVMRLHESEATFIVDQQLPATARFKVLDTPRIESQLVWSMLIYLLALLAGVLAAFAAIYIVAFSDKPTTPEEVSRAFGAPVLVRIPKESV
jgi:hypothetical protein